MKRTPVLAAALTVLLVPSAAEAHVSVHPNVLPQGAFATIDLRVPNETDNATTTSVAVKFPPGFTDVSFGYLPGWTEKTTTKRLAHPIKTDDGTIGTEVDTVTWTAHGKRAAIPPGDFESFPMSVVVPGRPGSQLTFPTVQRYSNGTVARWIGPPDADQPAPTVDVSAKGGVLEDVAGGEAGPAAGQTSAAVAGAAPAARTIVKQGGSSGKGLAIAALIVGALGLAAGVAGLGAARRVRLR